MKIFNNLFFVVSILFCFIFFTSCDSNNVVENKPTNKQSVIIPLSVGNEWTYKQTRYDTNGVAISSYNFNSTISSDTLLGNEIWYRKSDGEYAINRNDGLWILLVEEVDLMNLDLQTLLSRAKLKLAYPSYKGNIL